MEISEKKYRHLTLESGEITLIVSSTNNDVRQGETITVKNGSKVARAYVSQVLAMGDEKGLVLIPS